MDNKYYTARELAEILKVHPQTIYRLANEGKLESIKIGYSRRFLMPDKETKQCYYAKEKECL